MEFADISFFESLTSQPSNFVVYNNSVQNSRIDACNNIAVNNSTGTKAKLITVIATILTLMAGATTYTGYISYKEAEKIAKKYNMTIQEVSTIIDNLKSTLSDMESQINEIEEADKKRREKAAEAEKRRERAKELRKGYKPWSPEIASPEEQVVESEQEEPGYRKFHENGMKGVRDTIPGRWIFGKNE